MQNEILLPYYLQQHEITKSQLTNFSQIPNAAESLQMTMNHTYWWIVNDIE